MPQIRKPEMRFSALEKKKTLANTYSTWSDKIIFKKSCLRTVSYRGFNHTCNSQ